jgi:hypothetical protein
VTSRKQFRFVSVFDDQSNRFFRRVSSLIVKGSWNHLFGPSTHVLATAGQNCFNDVVVPGASAEVSFEAFSNFLLGGGWIFLK